ncbi:MAG TPA: transposase [Candidatus Hydrogenedentes bacterium]|nr:transposase [Candidatus Hydrogenedentota bacterium]
METNQAIQVAHPLGEEKTGNEGGQDASIFVDTYGGRVHVQWDRSRAVTPFGQLAFFIDFLKTAELFDLWVEECPVTYQSNRAPGKVDVLGTLLLSVLAGHTRYAHIESVRYDAVNPPLLGMKKVVSSSSARRAFGPVEAQACTSWQQRHLHRCYEPLLYEPWILDVDTTVKPLFGHQEGAVVGYNPMKPGRPSHVLHTYFMANTRLVLDVEVRPGNENAAKHTMPGLWAFLDELPRAAWPCFIRGDCNYGNERDMRDAEMRDVAYLFKLRQTSKVKKLIQQVFCRNDWQRAGQRWEGVEERLQLSGWTRNRRVIVLRRKIKASIAVSPCSQPALGTEQLQLIETEEGAVQYEYVVLVTSLTDEIAAVAQHYRDRGDAENIYDEQKNQWGWGGYTTHDMKRCQIMARLIGLIYNWWSLYVRLAIPERHAEAITSRPLLLYGVGHQTCHGGQTTLTITPMHAEAHRAQELLTKLNSFLCEVKATARQLDWTERWRTILARVFTKILAGRPLASPSLLPAPT